MWTYTFINQYGVIFTYQTGEAPDMSDLAYIKYCLDRGSVLVSMKPVALDTP